jgi:hypothetical protein
VAVVESRTNLRTSRRDVVELESEAKAIMQKYKGVKGQLYSKNNHQSSDLQIQKINQESST